VSQRMLRAANKAHQRLTAPSITTGGGRENVSRNFRGGEKEYKERYALEPVGRKGGGQ
jgi:hypothetical protein